MKCFRKPGTLFFFWLPPSGFEAKIHRFTADVNRWKEEQTSAGQGYRGMEKRRGQRVELLPLPTVHGHSSVH